VTLRWAMGFYTCVVMSLVAAAIAVGLRGARRTGAGRGARQIDTSRRPAAGRWFIALTLTATPHTL